MNKIILRIPILPIGPSIAYIPLTQGQYSLIEVEDLEVVSKWNWCCMDNRKRGSGYRAIRLNWIPDKKTTRIAFMHRELMNPPSDMVVDHINRNPLDNRRSNLRVVTPYENNQNRVLTHNGYRIEGKGINRTPNGKRWRARICVKGKQKELGVFDTKEEALKARTRAEELYW